jgi:uncharacterized protein (TIGR03435 family)
MRRYAMFAVLAVLTAPVFAQTPASTPLAAQPAAAQPAVAVTSGGAPEKFLAADVRVDPPAGQTRYDTNHFGDRAMLRQFTMSDLIAYAYGLKDSSYLRGGPSWIDWDRYDIVAKSPPGALEPKDRQLMLQDLLAERFKLVAHPGDVPAPAYLLRVAKGKPNLKPSTSAEKGSCKSPPSAKSESGSVPLIVIECRGVSMDSLANTLTTMGGNYLDYYHPKPVVDATGLKGAYDFDLQWTEWPGAGGISLFQAVEQQLGLTLELKTVPRPGLEVDSVNEEPTPNSPDLDEIMPPLQPQHFEVATIRPAQPDEPTRRRVTADEINYQGVSLKSLIVSAWGLNPNNDQALLAPKWIADDRIDIHAKLPAGEVINPDVGRLPLLRQILIDRFQIKYHMEERPMDAYTLVAVHPKLTRADPPERTGCSPAPLVEFACHNMTMGQFAEWLHIAAGYVGDFPVKDATGLKGAWDFTLHWSNINFFRNGAGPGTAQTSASGDAPAASEPSDTISLFDALTQQLGLKAVKEKRPEPVLVIDQINQQPTEN